MNDKVNQLPYLPHCRQFTIPLLFDDCPSIYQKLCSIWAKLNELIDKYNSLLDTLDEKFSQIDSKIQEVDAEIATIKQQLTELRNQITAINNQLTAIENRLQAAETNITNLRTYVESEVSDINTSLDRFNRDINNLSTRLTAVEQKVNALEQLLANLHIDIPVELLSDAAWNTLRGNWWTWFCTNIIPVPAGSGWTLSDKVYAYDTNTLPHSLKIGRVGQNIVLAKLPFIAVNKAVGTGATVPQACKDLVNSLSPLYYSKLGTPFTPASGFFNWTSSTAFPYELDECKIRTSYIPFLPDKSKLYSLEENSANPTPSARAIECDVRIQLNQNMTSQKMCVAGNSVYVGICPDSPTLTSTTTWSVYIYQICENS